MTSIISPTLAATQLATQAQASLVEASRALSPAPNERRPAGNATAAVAAAQTAIGLIDRALSFGASDMLSREVLSAFGNARSQAEMGVTDLTMHTFRMVRPEEVVQRFDSAGMWLGVAKNLLAFGHPKPVICPRPPITIQLPDPSSPIQ